MIVEFEIQSQEFWGLPCEVCGSRDKAISFEINNYEIASSYTGYQYKPLCLCKARCLPQLRDAITHYLETGEDSGEVQK